jgi:hypothetical protein
MALIVTVAVLMAVVRGGVPSSLRVISNRDEVGQYGSL